MSAEKARRRGARRAHRALRSAFMRPILGSKLSRGTAASWRMADMSFSFCPRASGVRVFSAPLRFGSVVFNALATADALDVSAPADEPDWPPKGSRTSAARGDALLAHLEGDEPIEGVPTAAERRAFEAFHAERERWRATVSAHPKKVLSYKFESNDGWIVSPAEARVVADAIESVLSDEYSFDLLCDILELEVGSGRAKTLRKSLERFRAFNEKCASAEGYEVR